jgi:hypothetical protein
MGEFGRGRRREATTDAAALPIAPVTTFPATVTSFSGIFTTAAAIIAFAINSRIAADTVVATTAAR